MLLLQEIEKRTQTSSGGTEGCGTGGQRGHLLSSAVGTTGSGDNDRQRGLRSRPWHRRAAWGLMLAVPVSTLVIIFDQEALVFI